MTFADRIRIARARKGLTQEQLAAAVGTSRRHIIRWEHAERPTQPSGSYQIKLAEALDDPGLFDRNGEADDDDEEADSLSLDALLRRRVDQMIRERIEANA